MGLNKRALRSVLHGHVTSTNRHITMALVEAADVLAMSVASAVVVPAESQDFLILGDSPFDRPSTTSVNPTLLYKWTNADVGDWLARDGAQGSTPYASYTISGTSAQAMTFNVKDAVIVLRNKNTGFHIRSTTGLGSYCAASRATSIAGPALTVITDVNTYVCPILANIGVSDPFADTLRAPFFLRFDLTAISGTVSSASLVIQCFQPQADGEVFQANILDMPVIVTDPARQFPSAIELGWSSTLTEDQTRAHANCIWSPRMDNNTNRVADFHSGDGGHTNFTPTNQSFGVLDGYNINYMRFSSQSPVENPDMSDDGEGSSILTDGKIFDQNYRKLYVRFGLEIEDSVVAGINDGGIKLPGFDANANGYAVGADLTSTRIEVTRPSPANRNAQRLYTYLFGGDLGGVFIPGGANAIDINFCPIPGTVHWYEQVLELNTFTGAVANPDGQLGQWVDGVKLQEKTAVAMILEEATHGIDRFFCNVFHGGQATPLAYIYFKLVGIVVSQSYIGPPPRVYPAWRQGLTVGVATSIPISNGSLTAREISFIAPNWYSGGAHDPSNDKFYFCGAGGHGFVSAEGPDDGTICAELDTRADSLTWVSRYISPLVLNPDRLTIAETFPDGGPTGTHTYYTTPFVILDGYKCVMTMTSGGSAGNLGDAVAQHPRMSAFWLEDGGPSGAAPYSWTLPSYFTQPPDFHIGAAPACAVDRVANRVYITDSFFGPHSAIWDVATKTSVGTFEPPFGFTFNPMCVVPEHNFIVLELGTYFAQTGDYLETYNLTTEVFTTVYLNWITARPASWGIGNGGMVWDPDGRRLYWLSGLRIIRTDPVTWNTEYICDIPEGLLAPGSPNGNRVYTRMFYSSRLRCVMIFNWDVPTNGGAFCIPTA